MEEVKQTGLIVLPPSPSDYLAGIFTTIPQQTRVLDGNWKKYLPTIEAQSKLGFDTYACTSFSALNCVEAQVNFLMREKILNADQIARVQALGFLDINGNFNASDQFTANMSGTTSAGNDIVSVWKSILRDGLLPERDLPFTAKSFDEYYKPGVVTAEMKSKAKAILDVLTFQYEWVFFDNDPRLQGQELDATHKALLQAPLQIGIPMPAHHATMMYNLIDFSEYEAFDQYAPYFFSDSWDVPIHFAFKGYVTPNLNVPYVFTKDLYLTKSDPEVAQLQKKLNSDSKTQVAVSGTGAGEPGRETNYFGPATQKAVVKYQQLHGIVPASGYVGSMTRKVLNGTDSITRPPQTSKLDAWCEAIKEHEGWFLPGTPNFPRGSPSFRNNNPGNLRYVGQRRATGRTADNFCVFATYDDGYSELKDMLVRAATGGSKNYSPDMTLVEFYAGIPGKYPGYAPSSDNNDPVAYANAVAKRIGVYTTTQIKNLI